MSLSLSTHWNAFRHRSGEDLVGEITDLGFHSIELSYDLRPDLVPGIRRKVDAKAVRVSSVHAYCPVPVGAPRGHPELFLLSSLRRRERESALTHLLRTVEFAADMGAAAVVLHAGRVNMRDFTPKLLALYERGRRNEPDYEKVRMKTIVAREKNVKPHMELLLAGLARIEPILHQAGVVLGLENLPTWDAIPSETEVELICRSLDSPYVRYWHDVGHGQIRDLLGFIHHGYWLDRLAPWLAGCHLHDVTPPTFDHLMPPAGQVPFASLAAALARAPIRVLEPAPGLPAAAVQAGHAHLMSLFSAVAPPATHPATGGV